MVKPIKKQDKGRGESFQGKTALEIEALTNPILAIELGYNRRKTLFNHISRVSWDNKYRPVLEDEELLIDQSHLPNHKKSYIIDWKVFTNKIFELLLNDLKDNLSNVKRFQEEILNRDQSYSVINHYKNQILDERKQISKLFNRYADKSIIKKKYRMQRLQTSYEINNLRDIEKEAKQYIKKLEQFISNFKKYSLSFKDKNKLNWFRCVVFSYFERVFMYKLLQKGVSQNAVEYPSIIKIVKNVFENASAGNSIEFHMSYYYDIKKTKEYMKEFNDLAMKYWYFSRDFDSVLISLPVKQKWFKDMEKQLEEYEEKRMIEYQEKMEKEFEDKFSKAKTFKEKYQLIFDYHGEDSADAFFDKEFPIN